MLWLVSDVIVVVSVDILLASVEKKLETIGFESVVEIFTSVVTVPVVLGFASFVIVVVSVVNSLETVSVESDAVLVEDRFSSVVSNVKKNLSNMFFFPRLEL